MSTKLRFGLKVREVEPQEMHAVLAMREAWYKANELSIVAIQPIAVWMVAEYVLTGQIVACMAVIPPEMNPNGDVFVSDLYTDSTGSREGKLGIRAFLEKLDDLPNRKLTSVPVLNDALLTILRNAGYLDLEIVLQKGQPCQPHLSRQSSVLA